MSQSSIVKTVGGLTTKITTMTTKVTSSSQQKIQQQQQQQQTKQQVTTKPQHKTEARMENHTSNSSFEKNQQNQHYEVPAPAPKMKPQQSRTEDTCVSCNRIVYKMEEVIAEHQVWHRSCFRCKECNKPLNRHSKVDNFHIHDGVVYCKFHFKQLFAPKDAPKRKPELIIRENQPAELPDGVVRSSEQYHLGLEDIHTAAVKKRFQMFEKISTTKKAPYELQHKIGIKRSATVISKTEKFHAKGMDLDDDDADSIHSEDYDDDVDVDLIRAKRAQRERPLGIDNMNEIKNKFEAGMEQGREARHEERKQEIQNIRSRLFWGKQARTKEMYQNAVEDLQSKSKLRNKGFSTASDLDNVIAAAKKAQNIKQQFETGDVYRRKSYPAQGSETSQISNKVAERMQMLAKQQAQDHVIKSHARVKIAEKADISNQFDFFENYSPEEHQGKEIEPSPPRPNKKQPISAEDNGTENSAIKIDGFQMDGLKIDGVVAKAKNTYIDRVNKSETINKNRRNEKAADQRRVQQNQIPSKIANGKRVDDAQNQQILTELKPSTEEMRRRNDDTESEAESEISSRKPGYLDSDLEHARLAARTKDLKDLFEKWNYENNVYDTAAYNDSIPEYDEIDDSQTETTKTIRAKFEKLPHSGRIQNTKPQKANRFVD